MAQYRKKPVVIEAVEWTGANHLITETFMKGSGAYISRDNRVLGEIVVPTLEGEMRAQVGDWIIKEPFPTGDRKFYPCKPDIFETTYDLVIEETYKKKLRDAYYPRGMIKDWDEDQCEAEWSALGENRIR